MSRVVRVYCCLMLLLPLLLCCCDPTKHPFRDAVQKDEILVYCGATMLQPVMELAAIMEKEKNCEVKISYGGSGHLTTSAKVNRIGEIFFPGSDSYIHELQKQGLISETVDIGVNELAFFVRKGNPKNVYPGLSQLMRLDLQVVMGASNAGSIGKATEQCLTEQGIYDEVFGKALFLTTDSTGLVQAVRENKADVVINWRSVEHVEDNNRYIDVVYLPPEQRCSQKLTMGLLTCGHNIALGKYFFELAVSSRGRAIFAQYGFYNR